MAINFNDNILNRSNKGDSDKTGIYENNTWRPYSSINEALASSKLILPYRFPGLTINILKNGINTEYWFRDGTANNQLIEKTAGSETNIKKLTYNSLTNGTTYTSSLLKDIVFYIYQTSVAKFLQSPLEYTILPDGGFTLINPLVTDDVIYLFAGAFSGGGTDPGILFRYVTSDSNDHLEVLDGVTSKIVIDRDITIGALSAPPGTTGTLIVKEDDLGGHLFTLSTGNIGTIVLNTLPRAETLLTFVRTDTEIFWKTDILSKGITPTTLPVIRIDDYEDTLEVFHSLPQSEILMSINNGPWIQYPGMFSIGAVNRPAGYWRFKIKEGIDRLESGISYSLETHAIKTGFPYILPLTLS